MKVRLTAERGLSSPDCLPGPLRFYRFSQRQINQRTQRRLVRRRPAVFCFSSDAASIFVTDKGPQSDVYRGKAKFSESDTVIRFRSLSTVARAVLGGLEIEIQIRDVFYYSVGVRRYFLSPFYRVLRFLDISFSIYPSVHCSLGLRVDFLR